MANPKINLTPLIDICMSLLMVFMAGGVLLLEPSLKINVPEALTNEEKDETDKIVLYLSKDGHFAIDDMTIQYQDIETLLSKKLPLIASGLVIIKADKEATHFNLLRLMSVAKKVGANKVTIATELPKT
ncbi:MAG: biopolymer transporter ExbD [Elusimicrobiota bacterium]|jgi:biopolymer transport protein ExbD|nr:biopolymer transporter ExbD [Elusimicrobiota bacterium]